MYNLKNNFDLFKMIFSLFFIFSMMTISFYILQPFLMSFIWASIIVISTWPLFLKIKSFFQGNKIFSIFFMIFSLLSFFILPFFFSVSSFIKIFFSSIEFFHIRFPLLINRKGIFFSSFFVDKFFFYFKKILKNDKNTLFNLLTSMFLIFLKFLIVQIGYLINFILHFFFMLIFSIILYWNSKKLSNMIRCFASRVGGPLGDSLVLLIVKIVRSVSIGIVITSFFQGLLSFIGLSVMKFSFCSILVIPIILLNLLQISSLPILLPFVIWLYVNNSPIKGTILLIWSVIICILDNILRTMLINLGSDFPILLLLFGIFGGVLSFGLIGLFIGPVVLLISYRLFTLWIQDTPDYISKNFFYKNIFKNYFFK